jgi:8-oxo-dGTP pyrophosphatase MutT (NUDIX family)
MEVSGAGVLILTYRKFLSVMLIYCPDKGLWEDPGGRVDEKGVCVYDHGKVAEAARKELYEETGCLFDVRSKSMYHNFIDVPIKRRKSDNLVYRCFFMRLDDLKLKDFYRNMDRLQNNDRTPMCYLETSHVALIPLIAFANIRKKNGQFGVKVGNIFFPISNRIKRIMREGGLPLAAHLAKTVIPKSIRTAKPIRNIIGWKKGTKTYRI